MALTTPLAEYLLAYRNKDGQKLVRFGLIRNTIPLLPPGTRVSVEIRPPQGFYAAYLFFGKWSDAMHPDTINYETYHDGVLIQSGTLGSLHLQDSGITVWVEITQSQPAITTLTNVSNVGQFYDGVNGELIILNQEDYIEVKRIIQEYQNLSYTNQLIKEAKL